MIQNSYRQSLKHGTKSELTYNWWWLIVEAGESSSFYRVPEIDVSYKDKKMIMMSQWRVEVSDINIPISSLQGESENEIYWWPIRGVYVNRNIGSDDWVKSFYLEWRSDTGIYIYYNGICSCRYRNEPIRCVVVLEWHLVTCDWFRLTSQLSC